MRTQALILLVLAVACPALAETVKFCDAEQEDAHAVIITDTNVDELYSDLVGDPLQEAGAQVDILSVEAGEQSKSPEVAEHLVDDRDQRTLSLERLGSLVLTAVAFPRDLTAEQRFGLDGTIAAQRLHPLRVKQMRIAEHVPRRIIRYVDRVYGLFERSFVVDGGDARTERERGVAPVTADLCGGREPSAAPGPRVAPSAPDRRRTDAARPRGRSQRHSGEPADSRHRQG